MKNKFRTQSTFVKEADSNNTSDNWFVDFERALLKESVLSKQVDESLFNQISTIMNSKSKYSSVEDAVKDMQERSGFKSFVETGKYSVNKSNNKKIASDVNNVFYKQTEKENDDIPDVFKEKPSIKQTLKNLIDGAHGLTPIAVILDNLKNLHKKDVLDDSMWDDSKLIKYVTTENLKAKSIHP